MSFNRRMVLLTASAVAVAVVLSAVAAYVAVRRDLNDRIDTELTTLAATARVFGGAPPQRFAGRPARRQPLPHFQPRGLEDAGAIAVFTAAGRVYKAPYDDATFVLSARDLTVAKGSAGSFFGNARVGGASVRTYVAPAGPGRAVIVEEGLANLHHTLDQLALTLLAIGLAGVALAGVLALLVVRIGAAPLHALRRAAEHVGLTGDLSGRIATTGRDDIARLAESFNRMLGALEESQRAQRQLVADASHELRTPIASLRTNIEVLQRAPDLDPAERAKLLHDLGEQSVELSALVADLLDSASSGEEDSGFASVRLDLLVASELEDFALQHPQLTLRSELEPCRMVGRDTRLRLAVGNLLDNAAKWSPAGGRIEVALARGELSVRDQGPGFSQADLPYVFDRFYRSESARSVPGAGLGLAIVQKVLREHGGSVHASNAADGGALITVMLPAVHRLVAAEPRSNGVVVPAGASDHHVGRIRRGTL